MKCPNCGLINPDTAMRCDCGYDFAAGKLEASYLKQSAKTRSEERKKLMALNQQQKIYPSKRPYMVSLLAVMAAGIGVNDVITSGNGGNGLVLLLAVIDFVIAAGLWQLNNWARIGFILLLIITALPLVVSMAYLRDNETFAIYAGGLLIRGGIIYLLATNGKYFH